MDRAVAPSITSVLAFFALCVKNSYTCFEAEVSRQAATANLSFKADEE